MAKITLPISDKDATVSVPDRTARVQKLRETPVAMHLINIVRQKKPK